MSADGQEVGIVSEEEKKRLMIEHRSVSKMNEGVKILPSLLHVDFDTSLSYRKQELDIVIFLRDRTGIHITLEDGQYAKVDDLMDIVLEEMKFPPHAKELFALWLVSPLLELRLKRTHQPFLLVQQWDELCSIYTDSKLEDINDDEPVLMFQRNVFCPIDTEIRVTNEHMLSLLYHEAKYNVIEGRYVMEKDEYDVLAGLQTLIQLGRYVSEAENVELADYRSIVHQFYPDHIHTKKIIPFLKRSDSKTSSCERRLRNTHKQFSDEYDNVDIKTILPQLYRRYLGVCRAHPFYGSVFFDSKVKKPGGRLQFILGLKDTPVYAAINTEYVTLIDQSKKEVWLSVQLTELSWKFQDAEFDVDDDDIPTVYLQFLASNKDDTSIEDRQITKLLEIYSRQSKLMNALLDSCAKRKRYQRQLTREQDTPDGVDGVDGACSPSVKLCQKLDKFCLLTLTSSGEVID